MIQEELSGKIIGAGMDVLNELRPGLDEKLYERAMIIELKRCGHSLSIQRAFPVFYRSELIGNLIPDLIVDDTVIVDPKVAACFTDTHIAQMLGYLNITGLDLALLLILRTPDWNGNASCVREKLANTTHLIFMAEPYPCYPCNPWFVRDFEKIVASLAPK